jgi:hypothetical protein
MRSAPKQFHDTPVEVCLNMNRCRIVSISILLLALFASLGLAQDPRGAIIGRVMDSSAAVVPGVEVVAENSVTGVRASTTTNESGNYRVPFLLPGIYTLSTEAAGFKRFVRTGVEVRVSETSTVNIMLDLGPVTESIEVKEETPLLDTAGSSLGQVVDSRRIIDLPTAAGNAMELTLLAPGMVEPSKFLWKPAWNYRDVASNGNPSHSEDYQIDGVSNTFVEGNQGRNRYAFAPPSSSIGEFKMQTSPYDASVGHTMSSVTNVVTAGGTNTLHGEAHLKEANSAFNAPNFFDNKYGSKAATTQDHRFGASAGGPVYLPKIYNGKNRTFWHYTWEANRWSVPQNFVGTVPTDAERGGDFSQLLKLGPDYQIYDPASTRRADNGRFVRQPFENNIIPKARLDQVGMNLANLYPAPNQAGEADGRSNFYNSLGAKEDYYAHLARVDHAFSDTHRAFVRVHYDKWTEDKNHWFGWDNPSQGIVLNRINRGAALDDVVVLSPSLVLNLRYGLTQQEFSERRQSQGFDLSGLGFSSNLVSLISKDAATIPNVYMGGFSSLSDWESGDGATTSLTHNVTAQMNKLKGNHEIKFGADFRVYRAFNDRHPLAASPQFNFGTSYTAGPFDNSPAAPIGQELASMMLGVPGGLMQQTASFATQDQYLGLFIHDDYKITKRLTLNIGLRFEYESPMTERFDRLVSGFDTKTPNPIADEAKANYAKAPIAEIPVNQFNPLGGLTWVNQNGFGRSPFGGDTSHFMPRLGLAYQLGPKTVVRAGYGLFYGTIGVNATMPIQAGFTQSTPIQASLDGGLSYYASNANPFPNGLIAPLGPAGGLTTNLGQAMDYYSRDRKHPYANRWSLGIQHELPWRFLAEASYVGNRATRLGVNRQINATPGQYLSSKPYRDQSVIDQLSRNVPNPFFGTDPIYGDTTSVADLLRPYPEFGGINLLGDSAGYSWYHALQLRGEKRFSQGYTFQLAYTWSKLMQATDFLNESDPMPYEMIGRDDRTHRLAMSGIWELPFGRNRHFGAQMPAVLDTFAGGWQLSGIVVRQSGPPLTFWDNLFFTGDLHDIVLPKGDRSVEHWINTAAGFNRDPQEQPYLNLRTFPLRLSGVRGDGRATWDFSLLKKFRVREPLVVEFRADVYNAWNHPNFSQPDTSPNSSTFGQVFGAEPARNWQFGLNVQF